MLWQLQCCARMHCNLEGFEILGEILLGADTPADNPGTVCLPGEHLDGVTVALVTIRMEVRTHQRLDFLQLRIQPRRDVRKGTLRLTKGLRALDERTGQRACDPF